MSKQLSGLQKVCRSIGSMRIGGVLWLWDYAAEDPCKATEMKQGSERWLASERAKWDKIRNQLKEAQP